MSDRCPTCEMGDQRSRASLDHAKRHALDGLPYDYTSEMKDLGEALVSSLTTKAQVEALDAFLSSIVSYGKRLRGE
jgi:hypothetical protein